MIKISVKLQQALSLHQQGHLGNAKALYLEILNSQPNHAETLHLLGVIEHQTNNNQKAVELISRAIELKPNFVQAYSNRGLALQELKRFEAAIASYDQAIKLKPNFAEAYSNRGFALRELKQLEAAIASYDQAIKLKPDLVEAYPNRGLALQELERFEAANASYEQCVLLKPTDIQDVRRQAGCLIKLGRWQEAFNWDIGLNSLPENLHDQLMSDTLLKGFLSSLPGIKIIQRTPLDLSPVIFFGADLTYADRFAKDALDSIWRSNPKQAAHLHIMLQDGQEIPADLKAQISPLFSISKELYAPIDTSGYTARRFMRLRQLLNHWKRPILMLDMDSEVIKDLTSWFDQFKDADIGLYRRKNETFINQFINACMFYARPTQGAFEFLKFTINYIGYFESRGNSKWFIDQMALIAADEWFKRNKPLSQIMSIPETSLSADQHISPETMVLTFKGIFKDQF